MFVVYLICALLAHLHVGRRCVQVGSANVQFRLGVRVHCLAKCVGGGS